MGSLQLRKRDLGGGPELPFTRNFGNAAGKPQKHLARCVCVTAVDALLSCCVACQ